MKVPVAILVNMISTKSDVLPRSIPITVPRGVAQLNRTKSPVRVFMSLKLLCRDRAKDMDSADLWMMIAIMRFMIWSHYFIRPRAIPSNSACIASAIISTKGVTLHPLAFSSSSSASVVPVLLISFTLF